MRYDSALDPGVRSVTTKPSIALIGAGGVRAPLFIQAAMRRDFLGEIRLYDISRDHLDRMHWIARLLLEKERSPVHVLQVCNTIEEALEGVRAAVVTIRPGGIQRRAQDEEAALDAGVLGQETVGVCGCAMAMRTLPALLHIAGALRERSPDAWLLNFSNPVGITTYGLHRSGFTRTIGICDSANHAIYDACQYVNADPDEMHPEAFGLNHLSWTGKLWFRGKDLLPKLLGDETFVSRYQDLFKALQFRKTGLFYNEYLYYYYYAQKALEAICREHPSRGRYLALKEERLITSMDGLRSEGRDEEALNRFLEYHAERNASYMTYARSGKIRPEGNLAGAEGYAGVALDFLESFELGKERTRVLVVPNGEAIQNLMRDTVVEVSCALSRHRITTQRISDIPESCMELMKRVAHYECLTAEAILDKDTYKMRQALCVHPLVGESNADMVIEALNLEPLKI